MQESSVAVHAVALHVRRRSETGTVPGTHLSGS
jgi:hypothetical protein